MERLIHLSIEALEIFALVWCFWNIYQLKRLLGRDKNAEPIIQK